MIGMLAALAVAMAVQQLLLLMIDPSSPVATGFPLHLALSAMMCALYVAATLLLARIDGRMTLARLGIRPTRATLRDVLVGVAVSTVIVVGSTLPLAAAGLLRPANPITASVGLVIVTALVSAFLLQGIGEELIFRGYLQAALHTGPIAAIVVSAASFGVLHLISAGGQQGVGERILYLALPTGFALLAGALRLVTGSVWAAVGVHGGLHVGYLITRLAGYGDGPWQWALAGLAFGLAGVAVLVVRHRRLTGDTA
jgi:membrane protease YdiL (CAAX protease family)